MKRIFPVAAILIAAALWFYQDRPNGVEAPKRHPASHVIRVTAKLIFDGKPVEFDELIDCKATYRGKPTKTPHMAFSIDRIDIAAETPDGGMIKFGASRSFCNVFGSTWGNALTEFTPPDGWTPVLEWYDRRDPRPAETGILYLSETALEAEDGRLRIIEPFQIAIPEYPASDELIAEAERQAAARDFWLGYNPHAGELVKFSFGRMEWMLRIPESEWRNPTLAETAFKLDRYKRRDSKIEPYALARHLDGLAEGNGMVALGYPGDTFPEPAFRVLSYLRAGRRPGLGGIYERGIPRKTSERFALLLSDKTEAWLKKFPFDLDILDEYVPFTCIDGVMIPVPETPGLIYWFHDRCSHPDHFRGIDFFGKPVAGEVLPSNDKLVFDLETGDLWWLHEN